MFLSRYVSFTSIAMNKYKKAYFYLFEPLPSPKKKVYQSVNQSVSDLYRGVSFYAYSVSGIKNTTYCLNKSKIYNAG